MICTLPYILVMQFYTKKNYRNNKTLYKRIIIDASNIVIYVILLTYAFKYQISLETNYCTGFIIISIIIICIISFIIIDLFNNK